MKNKDLLIDFFSHLMNMDLIKNLYVTPDILIDRYIKEKSINEPDELRAIGNHEQKEKVCDCNPKQACKICAASKDIDWNIIENAN
jgi:hypothetical protein